MNLTKCCNSPLVTKLNCQICENCRHVIYPHTKLPPTPNNSACMIQISLPIKLCNPINHGTHWSKTLKQKKQQQHLVKSHLNTHPIPQIPCIVTLTRIAPRKLDDDNLPPCFKWIRDTIADHLIPGLAPGRADSDPKIKWEYAQLKGDPHQYAVEIQIKTN